MLLVRFAPDAGMHCFGPTSSVLASSRDRGTLFRDIHHRAPCLQLQALTPSLQKLSSRRPAMTSLPR